MKFYNTINLRHKDLENAEKSAMTQNEQILNIFTNFPDNEFSPVDIHEYFEDSTPLTSIRRGISTLTKEGKLEKTNNQVHGLYGTLNYTWKLKKIKYEIR